MKKIKLLLPTMAGLATIPCLIAPFLTSCSNGSSVEIKKNDHITITADAPKAGEAFVIGYKLDHGYSFDVLKSTITIGKSKVVSLIQCTFDEENCKMYVPAMYITNNKITIDIKAEVTASLTIDASTYKAAWDKITNPSDTRSVVLDDYNAIVTPNGKNNSFYHRISTLYKKTAHTTKYSILDDGESETKVDECWSHADTNVGYWDYEWMKSQNKVIKYSMSSSITDSSLDGTNNIFNDNDCYAKLEKDPLFNCGWGINVIGQNIYELYVRFDSSNNITWYAFTKYTTRGDFTITSNIVKVSYDASEFDFPSKAEEDETLIHRIPQGETSLDLPKGIRGLGRYEFYVPSTATSGQQLYITFNKAKPDALNVDQVKIYIPNQGILTTGQWDWSADKKSIVIKDGLFAAGDKIEMTLGRPDNIFDTGFDSVIITTA